jgi:hypothetical protein
MAEVFSENFCILSQEMNESLALFYQVFTVLS